MVFVSDQLNDRFWTFRFQFCNADEMKRVSHDSRSRPLLWLVCAFLVSVLCFWYPLWLDYRIPPELDSRIWLIMPMFLPFVLIASLVAIVSFAFLCRASRNRDSVKVLMLVIV